MIYTVFGKEPNEKKCKMQQRNEISSNLTLPEGDPLVWSCRRWSPCPWQTTAEGTWIPGNCGSRGAPSRTRRSRVSWVLPSSLRRARARRPCATPPCRETPTASWGPRRKAACHSDRSSAVPSNLVPSRTGACIYSRGNSNDGLTLTNVRYCKLRFKFAVFPQ